MSEFAFRPLPSTFCLPNLTMVTSRAFTLKVNPHANSIHEKMHKWFLSFNVYDTAKALAYIDRGRFDIYAGLSFPDADVEHLETCLAFFYWAFSTDDLSDEGQLQDKPEDVKAGLDVSRHVLSDPFFEVPSQGYPHAKMLNDLYKRIRATASPGTCKRFTRAFEQFGNSQIEQSHRRSVSKMLSVNDFILTRRATIGAALVEAMVEYSLDLDIPDYIFEDPTVVAMSEATTDIMTWPNDICSFNKEQADGDFQNLVCCVMVERQVELQEAIDTVIDMLNSRISEYIGLKAQLPSFGPKVDSELVKYHTALEHYVQGTIVWYYLSPRYFTSQELVRHESVLIELKKFSA
ncbi:hypothetical protein D9756_001012 [Leucocoprinus leucothites]|uniref:Terpene synthase n=1 Tax=Leucocoprinus leucothites TaxID=201217 RepID=A0A8H5GE49_9AGAR|nr:hypothetical protein D9756_001012 [Leucoagaricus leucothites]